MKKSLPLLVVLLIAACTHPQGKVAKQIAEAEKELFADSSSLAPDRVKANEMIKLYISYADQFPDDTASGSYLFKAGDVAFRIRQPQQALDLFGRVQRYQSNPKAAVALFLQGFINETELNDKAKAKSYYEEFLKKYPNHELSKDVQTSINNLGKSDEELIREFEAKLHAQDSLAKK